MRAQRPTNSIATPKDTLYRVCTREEQQCRWPERWTDTNWAYWGLASAGADPVSEEVRRKRWYWIGHVLRKDMNNDCAVALGWKSEGKENRGRPKTAWRITVEKERDRQGWKTWAKARQKANNCQQWREGVWALYFSWREEI